MKPKALRSIYINAAKLIAEGRSILSCLAISKCTPFWNDTSLVGHPCRLYEEVYGVKNIGGIWKQDDPYNLRIFLLLLMAEWVKTDYEVKQ